MAFPGEPEPSLSRAGRFREVRRGASRDGGGGWAISRCPPAAVNGRATACGGVRPPRTSHRLTPAAALPQLPGIFPPAPGPCAEVSPPTTTME